MGNEQPMNMKTDRLTKAALTIRRNRLNSAYRIPCFSVEIQRYHTCNIFHANISKSLK
jgi:hypothetical protein